MNVIMSVQLLDKNERHLTGWMDGENDPYYLQFVLSRTESQCEEQYGSWQVREIEVENICTSPLIQIENGATHYFSYGGYGWAYDTNTSSVYICNRNITI